MKANYDIYCTQVNKSSLRQDDGCIRTYINDVHLSMAAFDYAVSKLYLRA